MSEGREIFSELSFVLVVTFPPIILNLWHQMFWPPPTFFHECFACSCSSRNWWRRGRRGLLFFSLPFQKWNHPNFWRRPRFSRSKVKTGFRTQEKKCLSVCPSAEWPPLSSLGAALLLRLTSRHKGRKRNWACGKARWVYRVRAVKFINLRLLSLLSGKFLAGKQSTSTNRKVLYVVGRFSPFFEHPLRST